MPNDADNQFEQLKDLSAQLSSNLFDVTIGASQIVKSSMPDALARVPFTLFPSYYQLGSISFNWQLFMEQRSNKVFFGFRRRNKFDNSLRTELSFKLSPIEELPEVKSTQKLSYEWSPPSFIELDPPTELIAHVRNNNGKNTKENVLWLIDPDNPNDLFALCFNKPKHLPGSDIFFFKNGVSAGVKPVVARNAPIDWYKKILLAILPWIHGELGSAVPINLTGTSQQIKEILEVLSQNYLLSNKKVIKDQNVFDKMSESPSRRLHPSYYISDYQASITLRLDKEEKLSTPAFIPPDEAEIDEQAKGLFSVEPEDLFDEVDPEFEPKGIGDKKELFQICVNLKGFYQEGKPVIRFSIYPPDFTTEGLMFEAFLDAFLKIVKQTDKIASHLGEKQEVLEKALSDPAPGSFIFRIGKKGNLDIEVFVLRIEDGGADRFIMFRANFIVKPSTNTVIFKNKIKNLIQSKRSGNPNNEPEFELELKGVLYTMRLLWQVNGWKNRIL